MERPNRKEPPLDYLGREFQIGDKIVYPIKSGSSSTSLVLALVHNIKRNPNGDFVLQMKRLRDGFTKVGYYAWEDPDRINTLHRWENAVIVDRDAE